MKTFKDFTEACWNGYKQVGLKKKGGKMVPNCVPVNEVSQDKEIKGDDMSKSTKKARARHFDKNKKGPAPGDASAKTKPSKHTKKYDQMFGEAQIEGLKNKAEKTGISYGILKKVYDRGMAAYKSGHRPGATAQQWAFARVNSFVTKSKGTWGGADKDLAAKVRG